MISLNVSDKRIISDYVCIRSAYVFPIFERLLFSSK